MSPNAPRMPGVGTSRIASPASRQSKLATLKTRNPGPTCSTETQKAGQEPTSPPAFLLQILQRRYRLASIAAFASSAGVQSGTRARFSLLNLPRLTLDAVALNRSSSSLINSRTAF
jgi:hypothetical protein